MRPRLSYGRKTIENHEKKFLIVQNLKKNNKQKIENQIGYKN